jgi:orotidine-5'-phosphate decarboxylase
MSPSVLKNPKDKIIFALDVEHFREGQHWVNLLKDHVGIFKVGKQLFTHAGPKVIDMIRGKGQKVFLDLKFHDIPNTVAKAGEEATKLKEVGVQGPLLEEVGRLAQLSLKAGVDGVVASPQEIGIIRQKCGENFLIVTPGIRLPSEKKDDQKRTLSPKEAIKAGANYLVIGRPIKEAKDPLEAVQKIIEDIS